MVKLRIRWSKQGGHVHARCFVVPKGGTAALAGVLVFREDEWRDLLSTLERAAELEEEEARS